MELKDVKDWVDVVAKILLGVASLMVTGYFGWQNWVLAHQQTATNIRSTDIQRESELISLFEKHIDTVAGNDPHARTSFKVAYFAASELKQYKHDEFAEILAQVVQGGTTASVTVGPHDAHSETASLPQQGEYLRAVELAQGGAAAPRPQNDAAPGPAGTGYFSVLASFPLTQLAQAKTFAAKLSSQVSNLRASVKGNLRLSVYQTKISRNYAVVFEEKTGCPLAKSEADRLTSLAVTNGLASDAFTQKNRLWVLIDPQSAAGAAC